MFNPITDIPNMQLFGNRFNVLGIIWFIGLVAYSYYKFSKSQTLTKYKTRDIVIFSIIAAMFVQLAFDETYTLFEFCFGALSSATVIGFVFTKWPTYFSLLLCTIVMFTLLVQEFKFNRRALSFIGVSLTALMLLAVAGAGDYATYSGSDRVFLFWTTYLWPRITEFLAYASMFKVTRLTI